MQPEACATVCAAPLQWACRPLVKYLSRADEREASSSHTIHGGRCDALGLSGTMLLALSERMETATVVSLSRKDSRCRSCRSQLARARRLASASPSYIDRVVASIAWLHRWSWGSSGALTKSCAQCSRRGPRGQRGRGHVGACGVASRGHAIRRRACQNPTCPHSQAQQGCGLCSRAPRRRLPHGSSRRDSTAPSYPTTVGKRWAA
mmetsp:Transcript_9106/g.23834  ORF Transcript_9106/g.23834 Transcript_9106/m.23834 type:complete len:206 (+) Transcript_9106:218-835(+)